MSDDLPSKIFAPRRELGRTGFVASRLGIGDLADRSVPLEDCANTVRRALDAGLNLVDTAPGYENGYSEQIVGRALDGRRDGVFLIDKIDHANQPVAPQVDRSLQTLGLDNTDAFLFHGCSRLEDWQTIAAPGGRMAELEECIGAGKSRFKGISSHSPDVLKLAIESRLCDVVMFAVGPYCDDRFIDEILPLARSRNVGTIGFKAFGTGKLLGDTEGYGKPLAERPRGKVSSGGGDFDPEKSTLPRLSVTECVHYALQCDPDVALLGLSFPNEQDAAFAAAHSFNGLSPEQMADIKRRALEAVRGKGKCWWNPDPTVPE